MGNIENNDSLGELSAWIRAGFVGELKLEGSDSNQPLLEPKAPAVVEHRPKALGD